MHSLGVHDFRPRLMHFGYSFMFVLKGLYLCVNLRINTYFIITVRPRRFQLKFETSVTKIDEKKLFWMRLDPTSGVCCGLIPLLLAKPTELTSIMITINK
jgi:hypothetical protein